MTPGRHAVNVLVAGCLFCCSACEWAYPAVEGRFERTLSVSGPVDLEVLTGAGRIEVRAGGSSAVHVIGIIRARDDRRSSAQEKVRYLEGNPPIEQTGNSIRVGRIEDDRYRNNVSIDYEIVAPVETRLHSRTGSGGQRIDGIRGPVDAATGSGSIAMFDIGGEVTARTGSGGIELDGVAGAVDAETGSGSIRALRVAGRARARTGSGSIRLDLAAPEAGGPLDADVGTGSGSIEISGVTGSLEASSGSGRIVVDGDPGGDWKIHTSSGGVTLRLGADAAFELNARTSSGTIRTDHPLTVTGTVGRRELRGKVRGGGRLIEVRTSSGDIKIQ